MQTLKALINGRIFTGEKILHQHVLLVEKGHIIDIVPEHLLPQVKDCYDLNGGLLAPGFIDVHVNGAAGALLNHQPSAQALQTIAQAHREYGTTAFLPTLMTDTWEQMINAVAAVVAAAELGVPGILGIHLEGPYLNVERKGVHSAKRIRVPSSDEDINHLFDVFPAHLIKLITLAPERVSPEFIQRLIRHGMIVSAGHTEASYDQMQIALAHGVTGFTHLFNAMSPMTSREPGAVGAALDHGDSWCGLIVDGHHVHPVTLRQAIKAKAKGKMMLVTDAMHTVGQGASRFDLMGSPIVSENGKVTTLNGTLAGSNLDMATAVRNTVQQVGLGLEEALRMASLYPAQFLKLDHKIGRIAKGFQADLVLIDDHMQVQQTWIKGET
ncbi:MAG: N-acetylglucosamine-6-phosphate deacetylase [Oceanospirillaceae bacterium]